MASNSDDGSLVVSVAGGGLAEWDADPVSLDGSDIDDGELAELERLEREATAGRWVSSGEGRNHHSGDNFIQAPDPGSGQDSDIYVSIRVDDRFHPAALADQDFIAAARNALPRLIAEVRRLRSGR